MKDDMSLLQLLLYALFLTVLFAWSATGHVAVRADLTHIDSARGFTKRHRVDKRWLPPSRGRGGDHAVTASVSYNDEDTSFLYLIQFDIGTQRVALKLDTGSDLIWTQCDCEVCFEQPFPKLDTSASRGVSCFDPLCARGGLPFSGCDVKDKLCFYAYSYGYNSVTTGKMYEDTFTFQAPSGKAVAVPSLRFGCGMYNKGIFNSSKSGTGIAGFGRGPMSLPSQLKVGRFSHCFTTVFESRPSPVFLGTRPNNLEEQATGPIQSTPFVTSPKGGPNSSLYYLSLKGVTVGKKRLEIDASAFRLKDDGSGGTIINSGKDETSFPRAVFQKLKDEFVKQVPLGVVNNTEEVCFYTSPNQKAPNLPKLILHLEGADWDLRRESYVLDLPNYNQTCVMIISAGESDMTTIGNFQQQNMHIAYDLDNNKLSFVPARCNKL